MAADVVLRDPNTGRLLPGTKAVNPAGRPRNQIRILRDVMRDALEPYGGPEAIARLMASIAVGELSQTARIADRQRAAEFIYDRMYGKPEAKVTIAEEVIKATLDTDGLTDDELLDVREHLAAVAKLSKRALKNEPDQTTDAEIVE